MDTCQDLYYLAFPQDKPLNQALAYSVYLIETAQAILLLYNGISIYDFQDTVIIPDLRDNASSLFSAVSLLGGIGM
jgi:hypothetical protein